MISYFDSLHANRHSKKKKTKVIFLDGLCKACPVMPVISKISRGLCMPWFTDEY